MPDDYAGFWSPARAGQRTSAPPAAARRTRCREPGPRLVRGESEPPVAERHRSATEPAASKARARGSRDDIPADVAPDRRDVYNHANAQLPAQVTQSASIAFAALEPLGREPEGELADHPSERTTPRHRKH